MDRDFGERYLGGRTENLQCDLARSSPVGRRIRHRALRDGVSGCSCPLALALVPVLARALALVPVLAHALVLVLAPVVLGLS